MDHSMICKGKNCHCDHAIKTAVKFKIEQKIQTNHLSSRLVKKTSTTP
jgi:hypothetical protein